MSRNVTVAILALPFILILLVALMRSASGQDDLLDLREFVQHAADDVRPRVPPLPEIQGVTESLPFCAGSQPDAFSVNRAIQRDH